MGEPSRFRFYDFGQARRKRGLLIHAGRKESRGGKWYEQRGANPSLIFEELQGRLRDDVGLLDGYPVTDARQILDFS